MSVGLLVAFYTRLRHAFTSSWHSSSNLCKVTFMYSYNGHLCPSGLQPALTAVDSFSFRYSNQRGLQLCIGSHSVGSNISRSSSQSSISSYTFKTSVLVSSSRRNRSSCLVLLVVVVVEVIVGYGIVVVWVVVAAALPIVVTIGYCTGRGEY